MKTLIIIPGMIQLNQAVLIRYFIDFAASIACEDAVLLNTYKSNKLVKELQKLDCEMDVIDFNLYDVLDSSKSYTFLRDKFDEMLKANNIEQVVFYKFVIEPSMFCVEQQHKFRQTIEDCYKFDRCDSNYVSYKRKISIAIAVDAAIKCSSVKSVFHYFIDPKEIELQKLYSDVILSRGISFKSLYFNKCSRKKSILLPFYEYELNKDSRSKLGEQEDAFVFHSTANSPSRYFLIDLAKKLSNDSRIRDMDGFNFKVVANNKAIRLNDYEKKKVSKQDDYFDMLGKTKCSLVVKPYDNEAFSWARFCECLFNNCLPLVYEDCNMQDICTIFPEVVDVIEKSLLVNSDNLFDVVMKYDAKESERQNLILELKSCISMKHVLDESWLKERCHKVGLN